MKSIEVLGKSVDQAIEIGLYKLGLSKEDVKIDIISEGGLFDKAKIKITTLTNNENELKIQNIITEFLNKAQINCLSIVEETDEGFKIDISGKDSGYIIGKHGDGLDAFQYLLSQIINKGNEEKVKIYFDCEGYREKRIETLNTLAARMANKAIKLHKPMKFEPMNAYERRIIHTRLQENSEVTTQSQGEEPNRFLVIYPKGCEPKNKIK